MFSEAELKRLINAKIATDEDLGEQVGGSGHLGFSSYEINFISDPVKKNNKTWKITYEYTVFVETEFTYYPDNPPYEYQYRKTIFVDDDGKIVRESKKATIKSPWKLG
ncbi:MAG: hypothetical protein JSV04_15480 [Candidatus Heimdallarchaeota archaeon]|nr:MAG: hypothetical protein JSV04_15480 [Candidatus Heimdallarchaeota archaeon]